MKRYYTPEGEPDEAKTLWEAAKKGIVIFGIFCGICIVWDAVQKPEEPDRTPHWKNWDGSRHLSEVKSYDYKNGIIHYRDECTEKPLEFKMPDTGNGVVLKVQGSSIYLDMDVEELLDQLTDDADFYEYLERNMD